MTPASGTRTSNPLPTATALPGTLGVAALLTVIPAMFASRTMRDSSARMVARASDESAVIDPR